MGTGRLTLIILMMAITGATAYAGSLIAGGGGAAIGAVSGVGASALGEVGKRWLDSRDELRRLREHVFIPLPQGGGEEPQASPAAMLVPERAIVPFTGREPELSELVDWCVRLNDDPLRLLVGVGGSGKTRLVQELSAKLHNWDCNWVRTGEEPDALRAARRHNSLVIVDYAETKSRDKLGRLIRSLAWPPGRKSLRVLLIARAGGDWWSELTEKADTIQERRILSRAVHMKLDPIAGGGNLAAHHYRTAVRAFSDVLSLSMESTGTPEFDPATTILVVHIAALLAVLGPGRLASDQYDEFLEHEDRYWQRSAESCGLAHLSRKARRESVAELTLTGADTITDVADQLKRVPDLAGTSAGSRRAVAQWLQDLYPAEGLDGLGSFRPHVLAEHLVVRELAADHGFANRSLRHLPESKAQHAFTVLGFAAQHEQQAVRMITESVAANPGQMIVPAVSAVVETGVLLDAFLAAQVQTASLETFQLARASMAIPRRSNSLDRTATVVRRKFIETGTAELKRIRGPAASQAEIRQRQTELMEYARVSRIFHDEGRGLPAPMRRQLIEALEGQEESLISSGRLQEAREISRELTWINDH
jgi:hypothetical protein